MTPSPPPARGLRWLLVVGLILVLAAFTAAYAFESPKSSSPSSAPVYSPGASTAAPSNSTGPPSTTPTGPPGEADGIVPDDVTVFDTDTPGVVNLDPELLGALRQAATDAGDKGIEFYVNSGWRSAAYQSQLLREAVDEYGSAAEAARWVATPEKSLHVSGDAVDLGRSDATTWLSKHGAKYGLCQIYKNEPWHYELRTEAINSGCPRMYADPTQDPRLQ